MEKQFDKAIAVLAASIIILKENEPKTGSLLDSMIYRTKIDGLEFAIQCLEQVNDPIKDLK